MAHNMITAEEAHARYVVKLLDYHGVGDAINKAIGEVRTSAWIYFEDCHRGEMALIAKELRGRNFEVSLHFPKDPDSDDVPSMLIEWDHIGDDEED